MKINVVNTEVKQAGKRGISKKASRRDLERTLMDILTFDEVDFEEALAIVEEATCEELTGMIWELENEETTVEGILERYGF